MSRQVTIKDVARHCGYSFKTVARVIARHPTVADEIRAKVFESIQELGYEPNIAARNLRGGTSYVIGLVYENPVADVQTGALRACEQAGYFLQIMPARKDAADLAANLVHVYRRQRLAGMLLTPPFSENSGLVKELIAEEVALALIISAREAPATNLPTAFVDDFHAACQVTRHLIDRGHRRIGFIWGDPVHGSSRERHAGYRQALLESGIKPDAALEVAGEYTFAAGLSGAQQLLGLRKRPTAIIGSNDEIAAGALVKCQMAGLKVPDDVAIAGFENSRFSQQAWPPITTASQPTELIAQCATELLLAQLATTARSASPPKLTPGFTPELLVRASTAG